MATIRKFRLAYLSVLVSKKAKSRRFLLFLFFLPAENVVSRAKQIISLRNCFDGRQRNLHELADRIDDVAIDNLELRVLGIGKCIHMNYSHGCLASA